MGEAYLSGRKAWSNCQSNCSFSIPLGESSCLYRYFLLHHFAQDRCDLIGLIKGVVQQLHNIHKTILPLFIRLRKFRPFLLWAIFYFIESRRLYMYSHLTPQNCLINDCLHISVLRESQYNMWSAYLDRFMCWRAGEAIIRPPKTLTCQKKAQSTTTTNKLWN